MARTGAQETAAARRLRAPISACKDVVAQYISETGELMVQIRCCGVQLDYGLRAGPDERRPYLMSTSRRAVS